MLVPREQEINYYLVTTVDIPLKKILTWMATTRNTCEDPWQMLMHTDVLVLSNNFARHVGYEYCKSEKWGGTSINNLNLIIIKNCSTHNNL